ncbi:MAG: prenyltransferase [Candidatus Eremiobacteraeota bacterium]|nr:prenyltransferase [Candidatus Eremiobacteraeota bacterium]
MRTPFSGGCGVLQANSLPAVVAARLAIGAASIGLLGTILIFIRYSPAATTLAIAIGILSWAYSAPPTRLLARGLGELNVTIVVAMLVPLFGYAMQTGTIDIRALLSTLPAACAMFAMMLCVEIPDREADGVSGKVNLLVRFGMHRARRIIELSILALFVVAAAAAVLGAVPATFAYFALGTVPVAISLWRNLERPAILGGAIAARGVLLFAVTVACGALGYAVAIFETGSV